MKLFSLIATASASMDLFNTWKETNEVLYASPKGNFIKFNWLENKGTDFKLW